jgi:hypothetical protein
MVPQPAAEMAGYRTVYWGDVRQPAGFMVGEKDAALSILRNAVDAMADNMPDLFGSS